MKITDIKVRRVLNEGTATEISAKHLRSKQTLSRLAMDLVKNNFPAKFDLILVLSDGKKVPLSYEIEDKLINSDTSFHTVTFRYDITHKSFKDKQNILKHYERLHYDSNVYDAVEEELDVDTILVSVDFPSMDKVWASIN